MATHLASEVWYALRGALAGSRLPTRPGTMPEMAVGQGGRLDKTGERLHQVDVDQLAVPPWRSRWYNAIITAKVADWAATPSARKKGGSVGGPSGWPVMCANPLMASASVPNPGRSLAGPPRP